MYKCSLPVMMTNCHRLPAARLYVFFKHFPFSCERAKGKVGKFEETRRNFRHVTETPRGDCVHSSMFICNSNISERKFDDKMETILSVIWMT